MPELDRESAVAAYWRACDALGLAPHLAVVRQGAGQTWPSGPVLCEDFDDMGIFAIVWDGGSYFVRESDGNDDWLTIASEAAGSLIVFSEPVYHWAIGLYPRDI